jgi:protein-disulfide isomerase
MKLLTLAAASLLALAVAAPLSARARLAPPPDPILGNTHSAVRVIIYQDLECPDCARWHGLFQTQFIPQFGARVGFEFRDFPLPQHLWSFNAAVIARYLDARSPALGMAWRDYCFTHQDSITPDNLVDRAAAFVAPHGITRAQIDQVFADNDWFAPVLADQERGHTDKIVHTPTILFNGVEAQTPEQLTQMLSQALAAH